MDIRLLTSLEPVLERRNTLWEILKNMSEPMDTDDSGDGDSYRRLMESGLLLLE